MHVKMNLIYIKIGKTWPNTKAAGGSNSLRAEQSQIHNLHPKDAAPLWKLEVPEKKAKCPIHYMQKNP